MSHIRTTRDPAKVSALRFIPLAIGAPMGTPVGPSPCGRIITVPLLGLVNAGPAEHLLHRVTNRSAAA